MKIRKLKNIKEDKKGDVTSIFTFVIIIFFLAISFLIVSFTNDEFKKVIDESVLNSTDVGQSSITMLDNFTSKTIQRGFVFLMAFIIIGMMISSFLVKIHPIFIFIYIFFLAIAVFIGVPLANTYQDLMNVDVLTSVSSQQTMINWIMEHFIGIIIGVGALSMIITFGKLVGGSKNEL